jgi:hypothetical protein
MAEKVVEVTDKYILTEDGQYPNVARHKYFKDGDDKEEIPANIKAQAERFVEEFGYTNTTTEEVKEETTEEEKTPPKKEEVKPNKDLFL